MATKYWFAADYGNTPPQLQEGNTIVCREFTAVVNSGGGTTNGVSNITSLGTSSPDVIALCTLPGQGYGITIDDYYLDFDAIETGGASATLVLEMGLLLTSTTNAASVSSLDTGSTSMAAAGYFFTLLTWGTGTGASERIRVNPVSAFTAAATPAIIAVTYAKGALPLMITNLPGGNTNGNVATQPNSGLYDLCLTVTTAANTVSAVNANIHGYIKYHTNSVVIQS